MEILIILLILIIAYFIYNKYIKDYKKPHPEETQVQQNTNEQQPIAGPNYMPYTKGKLLTKTEQAFFAVLTREALKRKLLVCPKVRLEDIIFVTDRRNKNKYRGYIKSRHVDFVLVNTHCETVAAIELDDPSHNTEKAAKADQFKNDLFYTVKIPLIRICTGTNYITEINYAFDTLNFPKQEIQPKNKNN